MRFLKVLLISGLCFALTGCASKEEKAYKNAVQLMESGQYQEAITAFTDLGEYEDSQEMILKASYLQASSYLENGDYDSAIRAFTKLNSYEDSETMILESYYQQGIDFSGDKREWYQAVQSFEHCPGYKESDQLAVQAKVNYLKGHCHPLDNIARKYIDQLMEENNEDALKIYQDLMKVTIRRAYTGWKNTETNKEMPGLDFIAKSDYAHTIDVLKYSITFASGYTQYGEVNNIKTDTPFEISHPSDGMSEWFYLPPSSTIRFYDSDGNELMSYTAPDWDVK